VAQSSRYARGKRHSLGDQPLEPLSLRALQGAGVLSLLLILVVANSLLNGSGGESPFDPNPVAAAAERTVEVPGMRIAMTERLETEASPPVTITGNGTYNGEANLAEVAFEAAGPQGQRLSFTAILSEDAWFFRYPAFASRMPEGKEWLKLEGLPGQKDMSAPGSGSPEDALQMLRSSASVQRLGRARVGGAPTTRYRVAMSQAALESGLRAEGKDELASQVGAAQIVGPVRAEVFVTKAGLLRRMRLAVTALADGNQVTTRVREDFSHFGIEPSIYVPDDSQVYDLSPLLEEKLEQLGEAA
jgi:hypothetical protein